MIWASEGIYHLECAPSQVLLQLSFRAHVLNMKEQVQLFYVIWSLLRFYFYMGDVDPTDLKKKKVKLKKN